MSSELSLFGRGHYHFLLVICIIQNISILYRLRGIVTFTMYVTACDLEKSFGFDKTVEIASHMYFPIYV